MEQEQVGGLIILFGATGDLAKRNLFPSLYQMYRRGLLTEDFAVIGASRKELNDEEFRKQVKDSVQEGDNSTDLEEPFFDHCFYQAMDNTKGEDYEKLLEKIENVEGEIDVGSNYIYYYSISPNLFDDTTKNLKNSGIKDLDGDHRVLVEKPFGEDSESAQDYYQLLTNVFDDEEIYFVDHFNAMDYVENILFTRFNNPMINQMFNKDSIENIQISIPENLSVGSRGAFYDENGALLDMFQNHILQILTMVGMKLPKDLETESIHEKKLEVLKNIPNFTKDSASENIVRGQYEKDFEGKFPNYRDEPDVKEDSLTETYIAMRLSVNVDHLKGVPIYIRTGKALIENFSAVDLNFKGKHSNNRLTFYIRDDKGVQFVLNQKNPEGGFQPLETILGPDQESLDNNYIPRPYENVLYGGLKGDKTRFVTFEEIKEQWRITDSIKDAWKELPDPDFPNYKANSFGPIESDELLEKNGHQWIKRPAK